MDQTLRNIIRWVLSYYFNSVTLPNVSNCVIVTISKSPIIAALLDSFARRASLGSHAIYGLPEKGSPNKLYWFSLHDNSVLQQLTSNTNYSFKCLSIFELNGPIQSNPRYKLSWLQVLIIVLFARTMHISLSKPFSIETGLSTARIQRTFKLEFYGDLKLVRGTPFQSIDTQARLALSGIEYEREIGLISSKLRITPEEAHSLAKREFFNIAANPIRPLYSIGSRICSFIISRLFSEVITTGLDTYTESARRNPVVIVPMHRSHLDYILVGQKLFVSKVNPPLVAAGVNLSFWPIGFFIRSLGAYFVKRNARQDRIHALVLKRYVTYLVKRGHAQEFFIEGGRSRSGRMRAPKVGLLSVMIDAWLKGLRKDLIFVPVSITYENVIEDKSFGDENTGKDKPKESLLALLKASSIFKKSYGEVHIHFGTPISLANLAAQLPNIQDSRKLVKETASLLTSRIQAQTRVSLTSLIYTALMCAPKYALTRNELVDKVKALSSISSLANKINPECAGFTNSLSRFLEGHEGALADIPRAGVVELGHVLEQEVFSIPGNRRFTADFYKNSLLHLFYPLSFLSCLDLINSPFSLDQAKVFYEIFRTNFLLPPWEQYLTELAKWVKKLIELEVVAFSDSKIAFKDRASSYFIPALLLSSIEGIVWSFQNIISLANSDKKVNYNKLLSRMQNDAKSARYLGLISRTETTSSSSLQFSLEILVELGVINIQDEGGKPNEVTILRESTPEIELLKRVREVVWHWHQGAMS